MTVIELSQYRTEAKSAKFEVTFIGADCHGSDERPLRLSITIHTDDLEQAIQQAKDNGGVYAEDASTNTLWLLPWPCAVVRIKTVT